MAGLAPAAPGHHRLRIAPLPGGGITQAGARLHTPYGTVEVSWALSGRDSPWRPRRPSEHHGRRCPAGRQGRHRGGLREAHVDSGAGGTHG
ncbi:MULTISPECIES: alpha-L-rhamnosidase C-terminal domain-containing protein [Streptomyces]|uniref:alpha-L-rhamnosidase C-terminal domain-containing protein n=1 Tax=Streptomyces TaxID=1883 RepID=UPI0018FE3186|nr:MULTISPECIES: alpha-L-rhamnosidase C-terminal domain-containing protein [Streptomyces]MDX2521490.1 alpha-L-rhamnosidase C-terminal domain-containing protein [Streptomyces stelliscabiei]MDX3274841.1 alpha-L-rhamnosidase C-terminal domain-containing protein [Streptomyces scabiei]